MPFRVQTVDTYFTKEMRSLQTSIKTTSTCFYPQYRVLLQNNFSKHCYYKETCCAYFVLLGSGHIPAVVFVSACSSMLLLVFFSHKNIYLHIVCLYGPIELNNIIS